VPAEEVIAEVKASVEEKASVPPPDVPVKPLEERLDNVFQALFFEVAGLTLAVPLITLGGIHNLSKIGPLFGKPAWFMGVMLHREEKLSVVDTAQWVMPEKYDQTLADKLNYQYLIMLGDSPWGLASEKLVNTVTLNKDDVKWRQANAKRPWLAGMVKDKMCALLDVDELISMLNNGLGSKDQVL
jgi:purine-binding chemotaxis protein CheW